MTSPFGARRQPAVFRCGEGLVLFFGRPGVSQWGGSPSLRAVPDDFVLSLILSVLSSFFPPSLIIVAASRSFFAVDRFSAAPQRAGWPGKSNLPPHVVRQIPFFYPPRRKGAAPPFTPRTPELPFLFFTTGVGLRFHFLFRFVTFLSFPAPRALFPLAARRIFSAGGEDIRPTPFRGLFPGIHSSFFFSRSRGW